MIKIGNLDIDKLYLGSSDDVKVYLGDVKLYPSEEPTPTFKWKATYTGGTTSSAECDATSAITQSEISQSEISRTDLVAFKVGSCVTSIGNYAFYSCSGLTSVTIPNNVTYIGEGIFYGCNNLTSVTIPNSITSIGNSAFYGCSGLTSINIPDSVTSIGQSAFRNCNSLTSVTIGSGVTSIGTHAFNSCSGLTSVAIPDSVTSIGGFAFKRCSSLTSVTIPDSVTSIGGDAFEECSSLTSVTIPDSVTSIGDWAFGFCTSLTSVTVNATTPPTLGTYAFNNTNNCPIYVPAASVSAYQSATNWSSYALRIQAIPEPSPQWVTFNSGDDISGLNIYGIKGNAYNLSNTPRIELEGATNTIEFDLSRNVVNVSISGCYSDSVALTDDVEYIFGNIGCSDYFTTDAGQTAGSTFQLYIYQ